MDYNFGFWILDFGFSVKQVGIPKSKIKNSFGLQIYTNDCKRKTGYEFLVHCGFLCSTRRITLFIRLAFTVISSTDSNCSSYVIDGNPIMISSRNFLPFSRCFSHGLVFLLRDICGEIRILFSQQSVRYCGSSERMPGQRKERLGAGH
jgi:hypothetical protein